MITYTLCAILMNALYVEKNALRTKIKSIEKKGLKCTNIGITATTRTIAYSRFALIALETFVARNAPNSPNCGVAMR